MDKEELKAKYKDREINDISQLCVFDLAKPTGSEQDGRFKANVEYLMVKGIDPGKDVQYQLLYIDGQDGSSNSKHVWIQSEPECWMEVFSMYTQMYLAETWVDLQNVRLETGHFAAKKLKDDKVFSEISGIQVTEPKIEEFETPKHMAFVINKHLNYAVSKLSFEVTGYGKPMEGK